MPDKTGPADKNGENQVGIKGIPVAGLREWCNIN